MKTVILTSSDVSFSDQSGYTNQDMDVVRAELEITPETQTRIINAMSGAGQYVDAFVIEAEDITLFNGDDDEVFQDDSVFGSSELKITTQPWGASDNRHYTADFKATGSYNSECRFGAYNFDLSPILTPSE